MSETHAQTPPESSDIEEQAAAMVPDAPPTGYPFRCLGYDHGYYYVLPANTLQVTGIPVSSAANKSYLLSIAPLSWWEHQFPNKQGVDWTVAADALIRWSEETGQYNPRIIRGRGAWYDHGHSVLHLGQRLVVDGRTKRLNEHDSAYIYESAPTLELSTGVTPLSDDEAGRLRNVLDQVYWQRPVSPALIAGWIYLAPICGALRWRPHVWIAGQSRTGKTWVYDHIVRPCVGESAVVVQSSSTEAGIRQTMGHDARPTLFDEAEAEGRKDKQRIQAVLELARQASSEHSAEIAKGTTSGRAMSFRVRSMFLMCSINVVMSQAADISRFTVCELAKPPAGKAGADAFEHLQNLVRDTLTPEYCERLRARAYESIPTIRANAATLSRAVAEHLGDKRIGDQIGTLLAGAYSLRHSEELTLDRARAAVQALDWSEETDQNEDASDQDRLIAELSAKPVRIETDKRTVERNLGEILEAVTSYDSTIDMDRIAAREALERCGVKAEGTSVYVSNTHPWLRKQLAETAWSGGWRQILLYQDGAEPAGPTRFAGQISRAVRLPVTAFSG